MTGIIITIIGLAVWIVIAMKVMPRYGIKSVKGG